MPGNDSLIKKALPAADRRYFRRAAAQLLLADAVPYAVDRYVFHADYARVSFKSISYNLNPGNWAWDHDSFQTNQFMHPYHGSIYFNAFRSNGYSFWQSVPAAFVGSYIWETAGENEAPSPNDFINTSFGGIVLGEMTHRLANEITNNHSHGFRRQLSEVFALLVNPANGFNRILTGKWGRRTPSLTEKDTSKINAEFSLGFRRFESNNANRTSDREFSWYARARLSYGLPHQNYRTPFSNIYIGTEIGMNDKSRFNVNLITVYGSLAGWEISAKSKFNHLAILSTNYDYVQNEAFFYGAQSIKMNLYSSLQLPAKVRLTTSLGAGPVILAAVPSAYPYYDRNYDYGPGLGLSAGGEIDVAGKAYFSVSYRGGWFKTVNGNRSHYFLHALSGELRYKVIRQLSICAEPGYFTLRGYYKYYPEVNRNYPYVRFSVRYDCRL
ncbi:DUF3943 domain-containing protein [Mucilaginibacter aquariorum]|uniref:DUF3943 domain-containing protein n=1 Tax=Mucilaginibacter aquariorum TaxID=2967225 RepID=A0ABT1T3F8_9SPHI|nr:DUF3943 domain-containing protein [Mucilaginibacter aquariorum]MCQ6959144.1 DUF3943 domain-containing protein [Mucilaginibacter aquariorum]